MSAIKNNVKEVRIKLSEDLHDRLRHHAKRLGRDMNDIVADATEVHLEYLDDKEEKALARKSARKRAGAFVPDPVPHKWGRPPGLGLPSSTKKGAKQYAFSSRVFVQEKLKRSFRRWAEYIEQAKDRADAERRADTVLEDIRERAASNDEATACYEEFTDFMRERAESRKKEAVEVDEEAEIAGDVD